MKRLFFLLSSTLIISTLTACPGPTNQKELTPYCKEGYSDMTHRCSSTEMTEEYGEACTVSPYGETGTLHWYCSTRCEINGDPTYCIEPCSEGCEERWAFAFHGEEMTGYAAPGVLLPNSEWP